jgi:acetyl-CoA carboxylase alpha subunit
MLKIAITRELAGLAGLGAKQLRADRRQKFLSMGAL